MSFLPISEENKEAPIGQTTNAPGGGEAPPPQTTGSAGEAPEAPKGSSAGSPTQFGSSASKLGAYLEANAPQITQQAETITGQLGQRYGDVSQGITSAAEQFGQQVQGGYAAPNQELVSQAAQDPFAFAASPENVEAFRRQYNNVYTGPLNFESTSPYSDIQSQVGQAVQQGNLLGTQTGLQSYLQGQGPNPTRASSTLDALLLQGNPEAQASIRNAANQLGTLGGQLQTATAGANALVPEAQTQAAQAMQAARERFTGERGVIPGFKSGLETKLGQQRTEATGRLAGVQDLLSKRGEATDQQLSDLGVTRDEWNTIRKSSQLLESYNSPLLLGAKVPYQKFYGSPDLGQFLNPRTAEGSLSLANIASPDDYSKAAALQQLTGQPMNEFLDPTKAALGGTGSLDLSDFSKEGAGGLSKQLERQDAEAIAYGMGQRGGKEVPEGEIKNWVKQNKGFIDAISSGKTVWRKDDPTANAMGMMMIQALMRKGLYTPPGGKIVGPTRPGINLPT